MQKFTSDGEFLLAFGGGGRSDGEFTFPLGIAFDDRGNLYVVDASAYRVQKFTPEGRYLGKWGRSGAGDGQFTRQHSIAVGLDGLVYVTDRSSTLTSVQVFRDTTDPPE